MLQSDNILHISGVLVTVLISISVICYTSKFSFGTDKKDLKMPIDQIYDSDHGLNITYVCPLTKFAYKIPYNDTVCYNKSLIQWYNPWLRHNVWSQFQKQAEKRKRDREMEKKTKIIEEKENVETVNETTSMPDSFKEEIQVQTPDVGKPKEKPSEILYGILVGLLIMSALAACWEVFKDKLKRNPESGVKGQDRGECSLADFTINRHLRRESQQQTASHIPRQGSIETTAKVTQKLIHQSSLDRAFPKLNSEVRSSRSRRNSVPSYLIGNPHYIGKIYGRTSMLRFMQRQSVDLPVEEPSTEVRKRSRHFIRRH